ncbi:hypothetical protein MLD38_013120 [Melastoma candidum]|uniref:Uncharacterized protein n=2 Tax=Melastoma candidum TaxID=119954 RepID=A0ACB9R8N3_9MYRT|nr:hypothetical protein MLD38_013120 [Melastoma candidum]
MASHTPAKDPFPTAEEDDKDQALPEFKGFFLVSLAFPRILALVSSFIALAILVTSKQTVFVFGIRFDAYYSYASSYRFLMVVDAVVGSFSAVSLGALSLIGRSPSPRRCFSLFVHDVVMMLLMLSGCSAATAIGYVGKYGEQKMGWLPLCDRINKFCIRVTVSIAFSYIAFLCFLALILLSASKLVSH